MLTVHLTDLHFFAHHGVYAGEAKVGSEYEVHLLARYEENDIKFDHLKNVLSYEELFHIVKKRIKLPTHLLEEVADEALAGEGLHVAVVDHPIQFDGEPHDEEEDQEARGELVAHR